MDKDGVVKKQGDAMGKTKDRKWGIREKSEVWSF